ncbi:ABC transporter permease subunit [Hyperthermus butylicus]|uniref:ABC-type phosphate transport, permease n=1 Tax=Hyperthermus butylicus (strain DSM 5456 / JCM 9403 / PLM1-5) TaxID=415426 RepID=A2BKI2_HYPBU|nr:ABC transporter permease subunit [Hyperthermus butylicus]ABM80493.1 ABC-type phosphate transport, permease [Hyperthermus butylicus DSM 5456]
MSRQALLDKLVAVVTGAATVAIIAPLVSIIYEVASRGISVIAHVGLIDFLTQPPPPPGAGLGGIGPAFTGSLLLTLLSSAISIPVALGLALLAVEYPHTWIARAVRGLVKALLEIPTIVISMIVYSLLVIPMGGPSILAGAVALAIVMLPYTTSYVETYLENVPWIYREAGYAIGMKKAQVAVRIAMGIARRGVAVGIVMGSPEHSARQHRYSSPLVL